MEILVSTIVRLIRVGRRAYERKWNFLGVFALVFVVSVALLARLDLLPSSKSGLELGIPSAAAEANMDTNTPKEPELPIAIDIPVINLSATIANPTATDTTTLDEVLLKGAVRYPTSAKLNEAGNVVLFGHSSYLPIVNNQAYKTFNNIKKLVAGDTIIVYSSGTAYTYQVRSVTRESVNYDGVPLSVGEKILTLITCDRSLGEATDRSVVVADFVESHSIPS
jgi:LPXTG-site transpeptidase (sortase) family protein